FERRKRRRRHGIRQADAALVEADHARECGQTVVEPRERSDLALDLDVAEPLPGHDDVHPTRAEGSVGDMDVTALRVPGGAPHRLSVWADDGPAASAAPVSAGPDVVDDLRPATAGGFVWAAHGLTPALGRAARLRGAITPKGLLTCRGYPLS